MNPGRAIVSILAFPVASQAAVDGEWVRFSAAVPTQAVTIPAASSQPPGLLCRAVGGGPYVLGTTTPGNKACRVPMGGGQFISVAPFDVYTLKAPGAAAQKAAAVKLHPDAVRESKVTADGKYLAKARLSNGVLREVIADRAGLKTTITSPGQPPTVTTYSWTPPADMPPLPKGTTFSSWLDKLNNELLASMTNLAPSEVELTDYRNWETSMMGKGLSPYDQVTGRIAVIKLWSQP